MTGYVEPFLGSGAVFFDLVASGRTAGCRIRLADGNPDLIGCYEMVRNETEAVIAQLERLARSHARDGHRCYYRVRDDQFNPARQSGASYSPDLAAMFIYLNRTGYNGLFRVNQRGGFNVPAGRYANPTICDSALLRTVADVLRAPGVSLACQSFELALAEAGPGDFVYCDPPYAPLSMTARFSHYTAGGFSLEDQATLMRAVAAAAERGATVVLSNSSAPAIFELYESREAKRAGLTVTRVPARRAINSRATARGAIDELIISNRAPAEKRRPTMVKAGLAPRVRRRA